ncbi:MAG TPA: DUF4279 domain-containing protein [Steroidobacteraceae bacterium]|nr:DUF4279 domain-containing protein [Steroidobacteraceae bacterium]
MKPVPENILASGPEETQWYGGAVDRSKMSLRIECEPSELDAVSELLGCVSDNPNRWIIAAPESEGAKLDDQVASILGRLATDLEIWRQVSSKYRVDIFCGLFLERPNRGVSISPDTMTQLGARGIEFGFDIYAPD